jgi:hypothetical protein
MKNNKTYFQRLFTLQFTRKLVLYGFGAIVFLFGVFFLLRFVPEKAFEFSSPYFGTIKTTALYASNYLSEIQDIRLRVEGQRDTIDAAFANAANAQRAASNAEDQVVFAREQLREMETNAAFLQLVVRAYSDDREAFDELNKIYHDEINPQEVNVQGFTTNSRALYAIGVVNSITVLHSGEQNLVDLPVFPVGLYNGGKELNESNITSDEVLGLFQKYNKGSVSWQSGFLQWFSHCERFSKLQRLEVLLEIRKTNKSIFLCEWACREFFRLANITGQRAFHPDNVKIMEDWLRENGSRVNAEKTP